MKESKKKIEPNEGEHFSAHENGGEGMGNEGEKEKK